MPGSADFPVAPRPWTTSSPRRPAPMACGRRCAVTSRATGCSSMPEAVLAIDIGGTFTDVVVSAGSAVGTLKVPSARAGEEIDRLEDAVARLLAQVGVAPSSVRRVVHGSTVATNAVLQHQGPPTGLLTTRGFRDVLELRRIRYPERYNPFWRKPPPLVPRRLRLELTERIGADGEVVVDLDPDEVRERLGGAGG